MNLKIILTEKKNEIEALKKFKEMYQFQEYKLKELQAQSRNSTIRTEKRSFIKDDAIRFP